MSKDAIIERIGLLYDEIEEMEEDIRMLRYEIEELENYLEEYE